MVFDEKILYLRQLIIGNKVSDLNQILLDVNYVVLLDWNEAHDLASQLEVDESMEPYLEPYLEPLINVAVGSENLETVRLVLEKGRYLPNWHKCLSSGFYKAISLLNIDLVKLFLKEGANPKNSLPEIVGHYISNIDLMRVLIEAGADLNSSNEVGATSLMLACIAGNLEEVKLLLELGADIECVDETGWRTALYMASENGNIEIIRTLISYGAKVIEGTNEDKYSPLFEAAIHGNLDAVKVLIESGFNPNLEDHDGYKPIRYASQNGYTELVIHLSQYVSENEKKDALQETLEGSGLKVRKKRERQRSRLH